ncbi:MAG: hypothetical protein ACOCXG_03140 [Nanoarchaeota archaeon]
MGLFSKHKEETQGGQIPPPPTPGGESPKSNAPPMPPAPENSAPLAPNAPPAPSGNMPEPPKPAEPSGRLIPPSPVGNLNDIKNEVSGIESEEENNEENSSGKPEKNTKENDNEDLFNFGDLEFEGLETGEIEEHSSKEKTDNGMFDVSDVHSQGAEYNKPEKEKNVEKLSNVSFISNKHVSSHVVDEPNSFFITTSQFKALLEITDQVKKKTKEAGETYARITDIKSEEDIEFENMKKQFQYIEDKLYEVDNIIFEK